MRIRRAQAADAPALTRLVVASKASNGYDAAFMAACAAELAVTEADLARLDFWLAEESGAPLGCVGLGAEGRIHSFFVDPDHKRRGIGRALWQVVLSAARGRGLARLTLDADPAAVPFYAALGFAVTGEVPSGSIPGRSLPRMERPIAAP